MPKYIIWLSLNRKKKKKENKTKNISANVLEK
jgi:hypothetical protein